MSVHREKFGGGEQNATAAHHSFLSGHLYQFPIALVLNNPMNIVVCGNKQKIIYETQLLSTKPALELFMVTAG